MLEYLLEPFSYEYMQKAMWISTAVGGICAFLSAYLMLKEVPQLVAFVPFFLPI